MCTYRKCKPVVFIFLCNHFWYQSIFKNFTCVFPWPLFTSYMSIFIPNSNEKRKKPDHAFPAQPLTKERTTYFVWGKIINLLKKCICVEVALIYPLMLSWRISWNRLTIDHVISKWLGDPESEGLLISNQSVNQWGSTAGVTSPHPPHDTKPSCRPPSHLKYLSAGSIDLIEPWTL